MLVHDVAARTTGLGMSNAAARKNIVTIRMGMCLLSVVLARKSTLHAARRGGPHRACRSGLRERWDAEALLIRTIAPPLGRRIEPAIGQPVAMCAMSIAGILAEEASHAHGGLVRQCQSKCR